LSAVSHATADLRPAAARDAAAVYDHATSPVTLRTRAQVTAFFDGWDLASRAWSRCRCGGRTVGRPGRASWTAPGFTAASPARAPEGRGPRPCRRKEPPIARTPSMRPNELPFPPRPHPASLTESRLCAEHQLYLSEGLATLGFVCTRDI
jgi:hypothetical protein